MKSLKQSRNIMTQARHEQNQAKLNVQARRAIVREESSYSTKEVTGLTEIGEPVQTSNMSSALHSLGLYGGVAKRKPILRKAIF